jgi:cytochrome c-type biogenesis protein CcmE
MADAPESRGANRDLRCPAHKGNIHALGRKVGFGEVAIKKKTLGLIIGMLIIIAMTAVVLISFSGSLTPYVALAEARQKGTTVQVAGVPDFASARYEDGTNDFMFEMTDHLGEKATVRFKGAKPSNFDDAANVVVIGKYTGDEFVAKKMLVKCPSKYQAGGGGK